MPRGRVQQPAKADTRGSSLQTESVRTRRPGRDRLRVAIPGNLTIRAFCGLGALLGPGLWKTRGQVGGNIFATDYLDDFASVFLGHFGAKEYLFLPLANLPRIVKNLP